MVNFKQLLNTADQARKDHRLEDGRKHLVDAVELCRQSGTRLDLAHALTRLGQIERDLRNSAAALAYYDEAAAIYRSGNDALRLSHTVRHLGDIHREIGRSDLAQSCYSEALLIYRSQQETPPLDLANALRGQAIMKQELGELAAARALWQEAHDLYSAVNVPAGVAESSRQLARLADQPQP